MRIIIPVLVFVLITCSIPAISAIHAYYPGSIPPPDVMQNYNPNYYQEYGPYGEYYYSYDVSNPDMCPPYLGEYPQYTLYDPQIRQIIRILKNQGVDTDDLQEAVRTGNMREVNDILRQYRYYIGDYYFCQQGVNYYPPSGAYPPNEPVTVYQPGQTPIFITGYYR